MRRRDTFKLIPLSLVGLKSLVERTEAQQRCGRCMGHGEPLSMTYVKKLTERLQWVKANQSEIILEGAYALARAVEEKRRIWSCWDLGHTNESDLFPNRDGKPEFLVPGYDTEKVKDGDLVLANFPWPPGYIEELGKRDLFVIGGSCPWGGDVPRADLIRDDIAKNKIRPHADLWIETQTDHIGALVDIPGSAAPLGPESGPLNGTILWMMVADACRILAKKNIRVKIEGTEPELSGDNVPWADLDEPLMDDYFDTVIRQLSMIRFELGNIRKMANMAVDTLLGGGNVYFYSRYFPSLAGEAVGRRGGFLFAKGLSDGKIQGTSKDCVIMGTYAPDDEVDLKNLDEMKKRGMKIASIGPTTRDHKVPEGRAVFKETEVHVGRMMDTYGLFAIKGCNRKVCPTSGSLATSILWVMSVELAMEVIRRTGNTPAIHFNGALKWAPEYNAQMRAIATERGY